MALWCDMDDQVGNDWALDFMVIKVASDCGWLVHFAGMVAHVVANLDPDTHLGDKAFMVACFKFGIAWLPLWPMNDSPIDLDMALTFSCLQVHDAANDLDVVRCRASSGWWLGCWIGHLYDLLGNVPDNPYAIFFYVPYDLVVDPMFWTYHWLCCLCY